MKFLLLTTFLLLTCIVKGADYYVSTSGNDINNGTTQTTPWQTLGKVQSAFNSGLIGPGDKVLFKKGDVFTGTLLVASIWGYTARSGTATNPITVGTYGSGAKPIFQYPQGGNTAPELRVIMRFVGVNYYVIDGLNYTDLVNTSNDKVTPANCGFGIYLGSYGEATCNYFAIKNIDISLCGMGMSIVGNFNTVSNCSLTNFKNLKNTYDGGVDDYGANAFTIMGNDNTLMNNFISGAWAYSSDFGWNGGACEMFNTCNRNMIMYNTFVDCEGVSEYGGQGGAGHVANDNLIAYNKIINCGSLVWQNMSGPFAMQGSNLKFYNNVVVENNLSRFSGPNTGLGNAHALTQYPATRLFGYSGNANASTVINLRNNIFIQGTGINIINSSQASTTVHQSNIYKFTGGVTNFPLSPNELITNAAIFTNTTAADPIQWDYSPLTNSAAIDFGQNVGITKDFAGNTVPAIPNAGILETSTTVVTTLVASSSFTAITCAGGNATVTISATGGRTPYTGTGNFIVAAGTYNYTVTDASGQSKTVTVTVTQPSAITVSANNGFISAYNGKTNITVTGTGGTAPYTYQLNNGTYQTSNTFTNVGAGMHILRVKDANGCTGTLSIPIIQPGSSSMLVTASPGTISCNGESTNVTVTATGATAPYTGTGVFNVLAGTYTYTVTDAAYSVKSTTVTVSQPALINVSLSAGTITVFGGTTSLNASVSGGTSPFTYSLNGGNYLSSGTFTALPAGTHTVSVKDSRGCISSKSITITQPPAALNASISSGIINCNGGFTTITVSATGGVTPYTGTGNYTVLAGTYTYIVRDAVGSSKTVSVNIAQPAIITASLTAGTITTYGGTTTVNVTASGGTPPYTYRLNAGNFISNNNISGVPAGTNTITFKDSRGCTGSKSISITQPLQVLLAAKTDNTCRNRWDGTITATANGGVPPYQYNIDNYGYGTSPVFLLLGPFTYTVRAKDATGAVSTMTVTIAASNAVCSSSGRGVNPEIATTAIAETANPPQLMAFPNPTQDVFTLKFNALSIDERIVTIINMEGKIIEQIRIKGTQTSISLGNKLAAGNYIIRVQEGHKMRTIAVVKLN
ncbi:MAG: T9SS type A sorting domain-containing protein [Sphingobacteriales bacterium]|nr:T9SS type A sorting domain-containing protein [Sphingobacteriales bacterium]